MAVRMAQACQLDRDPDDPYIVAQSPQMTWLEKETRRRTWWMCFCVDRIQNSIQGTPAILPAGDRVERVMMPGSRVGDEVWFGQKGSHDEHEEINQTHHHPEQPQHKREGITGMLDDSVVFAKVYYDVHVYGRNVLELEGLDVRDLLMLKKLEDDLRRWFEAFWNLEEEEELMAKLNRLATRKSGASSFNTSHSQQQQPQHDREHEHTNQPELASLVRRATFYILYHCCRMVLHRCNMLLLMRYAPLLAALDVEEFFTFWNKEKQTNRNGDAYPNENPPLPAQPFLVDSLPLSFNHPGSADQNYTCWLQSRGRVPRSSPFTPAGIPATTPELDQDPVRLKDVLGVLRRSCVVTVHAADRVAVILGWLVKMLAGPEAEPAGVNLRVDGGSDDEGGSGMESEGRVGGEGAASVAANVLSTLSECTLFDVAVGHLLVGLLARAHAGYLLRCGEHVGLVGFGTSSVESATYAGRDGKALFETAVLRAQKGRQDYGCALELLRMMMVFWKVAGNHCYVAGLLDNMIGGTELNVNVGGAGGRGSGEWRIPEAHVFWRFLKTPRRCLLAGERSSEYATASAPSVSSLSAAPTSDLASGFASRQASDCSSSSSPTSSVSSFSDGRASSTRASLTDLHNPISRGLACTYSPSSIATTVGNVIVGSRPVNAIGSGAPSTFGSTSFNEPAMGEFAPPLLGSVGDAYSSAFTAATDFTPLIRTIGLTSSTFELNNQHSSAPISSSTATPILTLPTLDPSFTEISGGSKAAADMDMVPMDWLDDNAFAKGLLFGEGGGEGVIDGMFGLSLSSSESPSFAL
ncbi:hypothetical protein HK102_004539 [Quaeritorhiza haematococci]|nr:hypothetical protein HK102_004539 [Quaeritorhiza haematococci]